MCIKKSLTANFMLVFLFVVLFMPPQSANARCFISNEPVAVANEFNKLVLNSAAMLLPEPVRPAGLGFLVGDLRNIKAGDPADEHARERIVSTLVSSSWLLKEADRGSDAVVTMHHLVELLGAYENSNNSETQKDNAFDIFLAGQLLAEFGDEVGARAIIERIRAERFDFESRVGVYSTAHALIEIHMKIGETDHARTQLRSFVDRALAEFKRPEKVAWVMTAVINTAAINGLSDEAKMYFDIGKEKIPLIENPSQRKSMELLYARFEKSLGTIADGTSLEDHSRAQIDAALQPIEEMLAQAIRSTSVASRGRDLARLIDVVRLSQSISVADKASWLDQIADQIKADKAIASDPLAVLFLIESLSHASRFDDAGLLLKTACGELNGGSAYRPALNLTGSFITSNIAVPQSKRQIGNSINSFLPLLAMGLSNEIKSGNTRGEDQFPRLTPK